MSYTICQQCGSDVLDIERESQTGEPAVYRCSCAQCGRKWLETGAYKLVKVLECGRVAKVERNE